VDFAHAYMLPPGGLAVANPEDIAIPQYIGSVEEAVATFRASRELRQQTMRAAARIGNAWRPLGRAEPTK
jgi:hypothetical protein